MKEDDIEREVHEEFTKKRKNLPKMYSERQQDRIVT